MPNMNSIIFQV